ncbi:MAG TPA: pitrilysin family protein [Vicinamibacterales bacterium]
MTVARSPQAAGLAPSRAVLDNGAVVLAKEATTTAAVSINLAVRAGSACDPTGAEGTAWLLSRVIDRGTESRSAAQVAEELDGRGITLSISVTRHVFSIACTCLAEDFDPILELLADTLMRPAFPDDELAIRKGEVITAIRQDEDNPAVRANETLMSRLYPDGHPYGRPTKGTIDIVERLGRRELLRQHAMRFGPAELTAVIVGDVPAPHAQDVAARVFADWRRTESPALVLPSVRPATRRETTVIPMMNKAQADIAYGFTSVTRHDPDYYAFWLMNNAFGQYAIGGRLGDSIREKQGMAYYVSSSLDANVAEGPLAIRAGVSPANVDRAIASIDEEIRRLVADGLTPQELDESKQFLIGSMPRALETNTAIANFLQNAEFFGLGLDYDLQLPGKLRAVTLDAANAAARRVLDVDRATVVIAGPYARR